MEKQISPIYDECQPEAEVSAQSEETQSMGIVSKVGQRFGCSAYIFVAVIILISYFVGNRTASDSTGAQFAGLFLGSVKDADGLKKKVSKDVTGENEPKTKGQSPESSEVTTDFSAASVGVPVVGNKISRDDFDRLHLNITYSDATAQLGPPTTYLESWYRVFSDGSKKDYKLYSWGTKPSIVVLFEDGRLVVKKPKDFKTR